MKKILTLFTIFSFILTLNIYGSHVPGGDVTYECLGNNQYLITLTLYEDCSSSFESNSDKTIDISNDCGFTSPTSVTLQNTIYQLDVSQLNTSCAQSSCQNSSSSYKGFYMHQWQGVVTLNDQCDSWTFSYDLCCRNTSDNIMSASSASIYVEATLNNFDAACNTSPVVQADNPILFVCLNQSVCYSLGIYEPDGNTLNFQLVDALDAGAVPVTYNAGFSGSQPIPGATIDPSTGQINFVPTTQGLYVFSVLITETDAFGNVIGTIIHELQVYVISCSNQVFDCNTTGTISNVVGSVTQTGPTELEMCEGVSFSFDMSFEDPDLADSVFISSNIGTVLPGSVVSYSYPNSPNANVIAMSVSWTPPPGSANSNNFFSVTVSDNSCPVPGSQTIVYNMNVLGSTNAGPDITICQGDEAQLIVANGNVFDWTALSGDPIQTNGANANFSCNPCDNPLASPSQTTTYEVVSDLTGSCVNRDTVTVNVVPNFTYTLTQSATTTCLNSEIQLAAVPDIPGNYSYTWSPPDFLDATNISNPVCTPTIPGTYDYAVEVESQDGCIKNDTIQVTIAPSYAPDVTLTTNFTNILCGDTIHFNTDLGGGVPASCGLSANNVCSAATTDVTMGTGTSNISTTASPLYGFYEDGRTQMIYLASELQGAGFAGGKITVVQFYVSSVNSTGGYNDFTIKMGCTSYSDFSTHSDFEPGLTPVYTTGNYSPAVGWSTFTLNSAYEWDGVSNLMVEICYNNSSWTSTDALAQTATANPMTLHNHGDGYVGCTMSSSDGFSFGTSNNRTNMKFTTCPTDPDPANYSFEWTSSIAGYEPVGPTDQNPYALPMETTDYTLVVTELTGGCTDTSYVHIDVVCDTCQAPIPTITGVTCFGGSDGEIFATAVGTEGPPFHIQLLEPVTQNLISEDVNVVTNTTFPGLTAGDYLLRSYDTTGCWADTLVTVPEPPELLLNTSLDTIVCIGGTATMTATATGGNSAPYTYTWSGLAGNTSSQNVSPTGVSTYSVYALDPMGCSSDTNDITLNMYPPILTTPGAADTVCPGDNGSVIVVPNGGYGGTYNYVWTDSDGTVAGTSGMITVTPDESPETYYVVVTDVCETPATVDSVTVYWYDIPRPLLSADVSSGCYPIEVNFTNDTDPSMMNSCHWAFGDGTSSNNCGDQTHIYDEVGVFNVSLTVTSVNGCVGDTTYTALVEAYDYPDAEFVVSPNPITIFEPTATMVDSSSSDVTSYSWTFGENGYLGSSTLQNPEVTFPNDSAANFIVELLVTNANGCTDTTSQIVIMNGVYSFYVPSAFTPNADGVNDEFYPKGEGLNPLEYQMYIFDRWGNKIFETTETNMVWDGMINSQPAPQGVYVWKIITTDIYLDEKHENVGHVTLFR